jgi:hypothetical protein
MRLLAPLLLLGLGAACATTPGLRGDVFEDHVVQYRLKAPGSGWEQVTLPTANVAWLNRDHGASLLVNSHCTGVQDAPLEALAGHLIIGMTDREILEERKLTLSRREALEREVSAKLDGVPRHMMLLVLKKDGCVYDVVLDSSPESFGAVKSDYERVVGSLDVLRRKDWS